MKNKRNLKGFTLIELLAVIVILAVIALIAVPQVLKILNKSRLSAVEDSVYGIVKSAETYVSNFMLQNNGAILSEDLVFNCSSDGCLLQNTDNLSSYELDGLDKLEFKGTKPKSGIVRIKENGSFITLTHANINGFNCKYSNGKAECSKEDLPTYIKVVYLNPKNLNEECNESNSVSTPGTKEGCMKWYAYSEDSNTYTMILDHNTTAKIAWNSSGNNSGGMKEVATALNSDTQSWVPGINPRLITPQEISNITGNTSWTTGSNWYYLDSNNQTPIATSQGASKYAWLFDYTNSCTSYGCNIADSSTDGYWTSTPRPYTSTNAWGVFYHGDLNGSDVDITPSGVRPVITILKSNI